MGSERSDSTGGLGTSRCSYVGGVSAGCLVLAVTEAVIAPRRAEQMLRLLMTLFDEPAGRSNIISLDTYASTRLALGAGAPHV
jgi:hypothetical protein